MKNKHPKRKKALKMQNNTEKKTKGDYGSPFDSHAWNMKKEAIQDRVKRKAREAGAKRIMRKFALNPDYFNTAERKNELRIAKDIVKKLEAIKAKKKPFISKRSLKIKK